MGLNDVRKWPWREGFAPLLCDIPRSLTSGYCFPHSLCHETFVIAIKNLTRTLPSAAMFPLGRLPGTRMITPWARGWLLFFSFWLWDLRSYKCSTSFEKDPHLTNKKNVIDSSYIVWENDKENSFCRMFWLLEIHLTKGFFVLGWIIFLWKNLIRSCFGKGWSSC